MVPNEIQDASAAVEAGLAALRAAVDRREARLREIDPTGELGLRAHANEQLGEKLKDALDASGLTPFIHKP